MGAGISYDPGIAYRGDQYAFAGLSSLGQDVGKAIHESLDERRKQEQLQGYNDAIVNHAAQTGLITPEELNKYNAASLTQKTSMAAGYAANIHDDLQRQLTGQKIQAVKQELDQNSQIFPIKLQGAKTEATTAEAVAGKAGAPILDDKSGVQIGIWDAHGRPSYFRGMGDAAPDTPTQVDTVTDPSTGKKVGVVRKTGQPLRTQTDDIPDLQLDPSGQFYWDSHGRTWRPRALPKTVDPMKAAMAQAISGGAPPSPASPMPATTSAATAPAATGPVQVTSKAQFDALPSGAMFIAPDGSVRRKP
jgi:hypothetical protein